MKINNPISPISYKNNTKFLFSGDILGKYTANFWQCETSGHIFIENPDVFLGEAYTDAISDLDVGLLQRNIAMSKLTLRVINYLGLNRSEKGNFLDYGSGVGLFVRLMRDSGFPFLGYDEYANPILARPFCSNENINPDNMYQLITAFEVLEHLKYPTKTISSLLRKTKFLLASTNLVPSNAPKCINDWWYFLPETGQHINFYTLKSLMYIAELSGFYLYSNGFNIHLFSYIPLASSEGSVFDAISSADPISEKSLVEIDFLRLRSNLQSDHSRSSHD
jgi:hypothetical protein